MAGVMTVVWRIDEFKRVGQEKLLIISPSPLLSNSQIPGLKSIDRSTDFMALVTNCAKESCAGIVLIRNANCAISDDFFDRVGQAIAQYGQNGWSLLSPTGLSVDGRALLAVYASDNPVLPSSCCAQPIVDSQLDVTVLNPKNILSVIEGGPRFLSENIEILTIISGYLNGVPAIFVPSLWCGIYGTYISRDTVKLQHTLMEYLSDKCQPGSVNTFSGPIQISPGHNDGQRSHKAPERLNYSRRVEEVCRKFSRPISLSIIIRTQFNRDALLRRALSSILRAKITDYEIEVILSTDIDRDFANNQYLIIKEDFGELNLKISVGDRPEFSRVGNLLSGILASTKEYCFVLDDDDFLTADAFLMIRDKYYISGTPIYFVTSEVRTEKWTNSGDREICSSSVTLKTYPATAWRSLMNGSNTVPICGCVMPRSLLLSALEKFSFKYDLSEDYTLFLLLVTMQEIPEISEIDEPFSVISIREDLKQSTSMNDRRPWVRDITGFLADLFINQKIIGPGAFQRVALAAKGQDPLRVKMLEKRIQELEEEIYRQKAIVSAIRRSANSITTSSDVEMN
jgi:Glycosyl transferase family 2